MSIKDFEKELQKYPDDAVLHYEEDGIVIMQANPPTQRGFRVIGYIWLKPHRISATMQ